MYWHGSGLYRGSGRTFHVLGKDRDEVKDFSKSLGPGNAPEKIKEEDAANLLWVNDRENLSEYLNAIEVGYLIHFLER